MGTAELQCRLGEVARQLQACADDAQLQAAHWRVTAHSAATALRAVGEELAGLQLSLAHAQDGERRERRRADHDSLTSLPNRDGFDRRLNGALRHVPGSTSVASPAPRMLAVMFLDLDRFKRVNDSHGHAVGDALLRAVGLRLQQTMRAGDMVCRLGGDEFACLVEGPMNRLEVANLAAKLIAAVSAPVTLGELQLSVRPSVGIALCPTDGDSVAELLQCADTAMFNAKRHNSGLAFFDGKAGQHERRARKPEQLAGQATGKATGQATVQVEAR